MKLSLRTMTFCAITVLYCVVASETPQLAARAQGGQTRQLDRQTDPVRAWPSKAKRWALVIGVDQYRDGQINALKGSVNDAHNLASALVRYAGFPQDQVIVLTTDQPDERQPSRINILTYLSNLASLVPKDGLLLVSFAGHGIERGGQAYLIPSDARLSHDVSLLEESAVSVTRMHDRIKAIGVGQVIVLLDACRNDPGGRADAPNNMSAAYTKFNFDVRNREVQAFATFYATAIGQRAYEYTEKHQGYFTWAIVEALKGAAANDKGEVTLAALVKYVQENVPKRIAIDLGASEQQKPFATIDGYRADELVIAVAGPNAGNAGNNPAITPAIDSAALEMSFWESVKSSNNVEDFRAYLKKYPNGEFIDLARNRIESLGLVSKEKEPGSRRPPRPLTPGVSGEQYNQQGDVLFEAKRYDDALNLYLNAVQIKPIALAYYHIGWIYNDRKEYDQAIPALQESLQLNPDAVVLNELGYAYLSLKRYDEAIDAYRRAISVKRDYATPYYQIGWIYNEQLQYAAAIEPLRQATGLKAGYVEAYEDLGYAYLKLTRWTEAIGSLRTAIRLKGDRALAHYNLGLAYVGLGDKSSAMAEYKILGTLDKQKAAELYKEINK